MFGPHAAFIIPSYIITAVVLIGMVLICRAVYAGRRKELAKLEEEGITRRSQKN